MAAKKKRATTKTTKKKAAPAPKAKRRAKAEAPAVAKKPKRPAKANPMPKVPIPKTIVATAPKLPPKPKATITRAKAVALANAYLKENVGKAALYAPRASRFRLASIIDRDGVINVCFCHEGDESDAAIASLGPRCLEALVAAHPQLKAFDLETRTIRM